MVHVPRRSDAAVTTPGTSGADAAAAYDTFQYEHLAFRSTHPDWLGTVARMFGMQPAEADRCRVLELGCAMGGNLVPLAELLPDSEFVGVDLAPSQIARGRRDLDALGLRNVRLEAMDIRDVPADWGAFDYIVCHGVYSWVPDDVREAILDVIARHLAPQGVAYVSYNALPGWHGRGILRDLLRRAVPSGPPLEMVAGARRFLDLMRMHLLVSSPLAPYLQGELELFRRYSDRYVYFEYLVEDNEPVYLADFLARADRHGLAYLADGDLVGSLPSILGEGAASALAEVAADRVATEQYIDYLAARLFHRTLLCRPGAATSTAPMADGLAGAWLGIDAGGALEVEGEYEVSVDDDDLVVHSGDPFPVLMMWAITTARPGVARLHQIAETVAAQLEREVDDEVQREVRRRALELVVGARVQAGHWQRPVATEIPERPLIARHTRWQATDGQADVTTLTHSMFEIDELDRVLLEVMDGTRDRAGLVEAVIAAQRSGRLEISVDDEPLVEPVLLGDLVDVRLGRYLAHGLLLDPSSAAAERARAAASGGG